MNAGSNCTITASNFNVGSKNIISASGQGSFIDLEIKNTNGVTLLIEGDSGNITASGALTIDTINENTTNNGVVIEGVTLKDGNLNISGTLGVGTASNVGTAGALLTSNGSGAAVSWTDSPSFDDAKVSNRLSIGNVSRNQNVIFGFSANNLGPGTVTTIKRLTMSSSAGSWNSLDAQIQYCAMQTSFGLPFGAGTARRPIYWTGASTGQVGFSGNFAKQDSSGSQNDINFQMIYINNATFDLVFRNTHPSNSVNLSCQVNIRAAFADISF